MANRFPGGGGGIPNANQVAGYALKADISHYFESVDQAILLNILRKRIADEDTLWLVQAIFSNHEAKIPGKGIPLGNLTSQFFANVYLDELDQFIKHELKAKYYLRYVDDFVILSRSRHELEQNREAIGQFLSDKLRLALHPQKTGIIPLGAGTPLLGFRVFYRFRLLKKSNQVRIRKRLAILKGMLADGEIGPKRVLLSFAGWEGYAKMADAYKLRMALRKEMECLK